jgi:hypothetical protein
MVAGRQGIKCIYFITFVHVDGTRLRKRTTAETQTLALILKRKYNWTILYEETDKFNN